MSDTAERRTAAGEWPDIPYAAWRDTCEALHLYVQVAGKYRLAHTPWVNHSWHATLYVSARGLTTHVIPDATGAMEVAFDFVDHRVTAQSERGATGSFALAPMSVAAFHRQFVRLIDEVGGTSRFHGRPNELADAVPFLSDERPRPYDAAAVQRFHQALVRADRVLQEFRTGFIGKVSPVHLFWGSFDLAVTRFSGRAAPEHPGGIPALPDAVTREAYSHEVSSAGFWPGGGPTLDAAFYSYAYPAPDGFAAASVTPPAAYYDQGASEFILPYDAVRTAADPDATLLSFLESTYAAAARLGQWDRAALECARGAPRTPRAL